MKLYNLTIIIRSVLYELSRCYKVWKNSASKIVRIFFFNDIINIKNVDPSILEINKSSCKKANINIYHIVYIIKKRLDHVNIDTENPLYDIFNNVDGYIIKESNGDKYLIFASIDKNKELLKTTQNFGMKLKIKLKQYVVVNQFNIKKISWKLGLNQMMI